MKKTAKIGIVLDNKISKWSLQRFEPLRDIFDITVFVGERNDFDVRSIGLNKRFLTSREELTLGAKDPAAAYSRIIKAPHRKMDFYYFSLGKYLDGFDMVYSCDLMRSAYTVAGLKQRLGFKFVLAWWENIPYRSIFDDKSNLQKKSIMNKVDLFLPFTKAAEACLRLEGTPEEKTTVVYPGIDMERFKPGPKPAHLLKKNHIPDNVFVILYAGKLVSWKGVHNLIYAAAALRKKGDGNFVVAIAGKGAQKANMERLIKETGLEDNFRFLDFVSYDEMPDVYRLADVFVLPSYPTMEWQEQFGMVLVEAMACGRPVISTLSGSIPEVAGDACVLLPPGDFFSLANAIERFMKEPGLCREFSVKGRDRAANLFDGKKTSEELRSVFSGL
ncbi:MAG: glycosyltransferase family 4 protein [Deltaproteobacteria bacterium]|nr:glycosyltransferase family 4 protein [Deltaproteobacteria bacterium]